MKVFILAGGFGTRLSEETLLRPKPMVEIGRKPILWHIMKIYSHYGFNDFVILGGYKVEYIKNYFLNYYNNTSDLTVDLSTNRVTIHSNQAEPWKVTVLDTGLKTSTGSRIKRAKDFIDTNEPFLLTYGDGLSDVNIKNLVDFHKAGGRIGTVTAVQPSGRFGSLNINSTSSEVEDFVEKPKGDGRYINGGFFVFEPKFLDYIPDSDVMLEQDPLINLAKDHQLGAYKHEGFWRAMDTLRDNQELNSMWSSNNAPWYVWDK